MNATDSLLVPFSDAGRLNGLADGALGARYRFWRDETGQRHVFSVYPADAAPDYPDALAIVARRTPAGPIAMWVGPAGDPARRASQRLQGDEIHIHVLGDAPPASLAGLMAGRGVSAFPVAVAGPAPVGRMLPAPRRVAA